MLDSPALRPALVPVRTEMAWQKNTDDGETRSTPYRFVSVHEDGHWNPQAAVSDQYRLLDNRLFVQAVEMKQGRFGLRFAPGRAFAHKGDGGVYVTARRTGTRTRMVLTDENRRYTPSGGGTSVAPTLALDNDYGAKRYASFEGGIVAYHCTNLQLWGVVESTSENLIHKGSRNSGPFTLEEIMLFVEPGLEQVAARIERDRKTIELAIGVKMDFVKLSEKLISSVPERQKAGLQEALVRNSDALGCTAWAGMQAASEIVTHAWLRNGAPAFAAQDWLQKTLDGILETAGIVV